MNFQVDGHKYHGAGGSKKIARDRAAVSALQQLKGTYNKHIY